MCVKKDRKKNERKKKEKEAKNETVKSSCPYTVCYSEVPKHCRSADVTLVVLTEVVHHGNGWSATLRTPPHPSSLPNLLYCLSANLIGRTIEMSCLSNTHAQAPDQPDWNSGMKEQGALYKSRREKPETKSNAIGREKGFSPALYHCRISDSRKKWG